MCWRECESNWRECVVYFINPETPETIDVRDTETGTTHAIPMADVKPCDPDEEKERELEPPVQQQENDHQ